MIDEAKLQELQAKHPKGAMFSKGPVAIFCRKPSRGERIAFLSSIMATDKRKEETRALAIEKLVRHITVFPDAVTLDGVYEDDGFILDEIGGEVMEWLRGGGDNVEVKKL